VDEYEDDEDDETIEIFRSEAEAQEMFNEVFKLALDAFGLTVTRQLIFNGCKQNNIDLIEPKARDSSPKIGLIKVDDIKLKMTRFKVASLDTTLKLKPMNSKANILDNCAAVNSKIVKNETTKEMSQVRLFAYIHNLHENIHAAKEQPDFKGFLKDLKEKLELKTSTQMSKLQRKCKRVNQLVYVVGNAAGAFLLGMYITLHSLENDADESWKLLISELRAHEYLALTKTITLANDNVTPVFRAEQAGPSQPLNLS